MNDGLQPPVVTDLDRKWSLDQCPPWAVRATPDDYESDSEIVNDSDVVRSGRRAGYRDRFVWDWFVDDQIANFERYFSHERTKPSAWSRLWRQAWWPKSDPRKSAPKLVAKLNPGQPHPFARRGTLEFEEGLRLATPQERRLFERLGVVQVPPDDKRAKVLA